MLAVLLWCADPALVVCSVLQGLVLHEDLKARMRVLRRLGYIDAGAHGGLKDRGGRGWCQHNGLSQGGVPCRRERRWCGVQLHVIAGAAVAVLTCWCVLWCVPACLPVCVLAAEGLVTAKGRVAAELNVGHDELVLTELLLGGAFADITPDALAALCSCFVWSERSVVPPK